MIRALPLLLLSGCFSSAADGLIWLVAVASCGFILLALYMATFEKEDELTARMRNLGAARLCAISLVVFFVLAVLAGCAVPEREPFRPPSYVTDHGLWVYGAETYDIPRIEVEIYTEYTLIEHLWRGWTEEEKSWAVDGMQLRLEPCWIEFHRIDSCPWAQLGDPACPVAGKYEISYGYICVDPARATCTSKVILHELLHVYEHRIDGQKDYDHVLPHWDWLALNGERFCHA